MSSPDNPDEFLGSDLLKVEVVYREPNDQGGHSFKKEALNEIADDSWLDEGDICFVQFVTDKGVFELGVYNAHNGYYGHMALILGPDLLEEAGL